ncbi:MAG: DUF3987 domain-containing protein [bacterium]
MSPKVDSKDLKTQGFIDAVKNGKWSKRRTELRDLLASGKNDEYNKKKIFLPAVTASGQFKNRREIISHIGLLQIDMDKLSNPHLIRNILGKDLHIYASFLSPSAEGVKALMSISPNQQNHQKSFESAEKYLKEKYNLLVDKSRKDLNGLCFVSFDAGLIVNESAVEIPLISNETNQDKVESDENGLQIKYGTTDWCRVFESAGLTLSRSGDRINVLCPWRDSHTKNIDQGSYLFRGSEGSWGWTCHHDHCQQRNMKDVALKLRSHVIEHSEKFIPEQLEKIGIRENEYKPKEIVWPDPLPLPKNPDPPLKLDPNILPNPLSDFCRYSAFENETTPKAVAGFLLATLGMVTGTRIVINPDPLKSNWFEYPIRSVALVMDISSNKTIVFRTGHAPLEKIQASKNKNFNELIRQYEVDQKIFDKKEQGLSNLLKRNSNRFKKQDIEDELRNFLTLAPKEPQKQILITNRTTPEKLISMCASGSDRGILLKSDELFGLIAQTEKHGSEGFREFYTEAMTVARNYSSHTIGRGSDVVENFALSIAGCFQPSKLKKMLKDMESGYKDDGLLQRFMWIWPKLPSIESFEGADHSEHKRLMMLNQQIQSLFEYLYEMNPEDFGARFSEHAPSPWIGFNSVAQEMWYQWRRELRTTIIKQEDLSDGYVAWLGKSERMVAGLCITFHCIQVLQEDVSPGPINEECLSRAVDVWLILSSHAERVFSSRKYFFLDALNLLTSRLHLLFPEFSIRDLKQKKWRSLNEEDVLQDLLGWLTELNYLRETETPHHPKGGRPSSRKFLVNPKIKR